MGMGEAEGWRTYVMMVESGLRFRRGGREGNTIGCRKERYSDKEHNPPFQVLSYAIISQSPPDCVRLPRTHITAGSSRQGVSV